MNGTDIDLMVVGLGPVGDTLAALARLHGLSVIAIDRASEPYPLPRAAVIDHEIMRIFQAIGVAERIEQASLTLEQYRFVNAAGEVLLEFPIAAEGRYGWAETYAVHQPTIEAILRDRLDELGVEVHLGVELVGLAEDASGVAATLKTADGLRILRSRYLVGCDGASSAVREAVGIELEDLGFDEPWLVVDTIGPVGEDALPTPSQICDPKRPITHLPLAGGRLRWEFMLRPEEDPVAFGDPRNVRELLARFPYAADHQIERQAIYRFHALIAHRWRTNRVLLAGDAVHQMPPFAGQGMCSGIRDAINLAWKLSDVLNLRADPKILDTYQDERSPHVRAVIETAVAMGRVVCLLDEDAARERDAAMLARRVAGEQDVSNIYPDLHGGFFTNTPLAGALFPQWIVDGKRLDDVFGLSAVLIQRERAASGASDAIVFTLEDAAVAPFASALDRWLREADADAVLIRPDRHIFGTGDARALLAAWKNKGSERIAA